EYNIEIGQYEEAAAVFESLGDYSDSANRAAEAKCLLAEQYYNSGSFIESADLYASLSDYYSSTSRREELEFKAAQAYAAGGDYNSALAFLVYNSYEGAAELLEWVKEQG
ncbi:MAG: hypothetical protein K2G32_06065, partial [Oscillospiraceae bacterium]|nr:hypothetical protein [Oscillospiraceae bacterium]